MIRSLKFSAISATLAAVLLAPAIAAGAPKLKSLGVFKDWAAYTYKSPKGKVCYIVSKPMDSTPKKINRDPAYFLVTHRPADKVRNEVNTIIGYPFKPGSTATVTIDNATTFKFFTSGDGAWAGTRENDNKVVRTMKAGASMVIKGRSARGTLTTDKYSLAGVSAALEAIGKACK